VSILYALDPGTEQSALVSLFAGAIAGKVYPNAELLAALGETSMLGGHLVIEEVASYGMPVGREVFETVFWAGRFAQAWQADPKRSWSLLPRKAVKLALCGSMKAKDANIRQALLDRYGGKEKAVGRKAAPGPLYGLRSHCWAALALAVAYQEQEKAA
jgi:hypothetical protein